MRAKKLYLIDENAVTIDAIIAETVGKHGVYVSFRDIHPKTPFPKKLMKNAIADVFPVMSLPKAYKYSKEYSYITCKHDGKDWYFVSCNIGKCFAGSSVSGTKYTFKKEFETEILQNICKNHNISFA